MLLPRMPYLLLFIALCLAAPGCTKPAPAPRSGHAQQPPPATLHVAGGGQGQTVRLWAEPSLAGLLEQLKPELEKRGGLTLEIQYRESAELEAAVADPLPDVYLYPDLGLFAKLVRAGNVTEVTIRTVAGDRLVVASRQGEDWAMAKLFDIYRLRFKWLGLAQKDSALERLAVQALTSDGVLHRVQSRLKYLKSAADLPKALKRDEVQLIITYASAVTQNPDLGVSVLIDPGLHEDIRYKAAAAPAKADEPGVLTLLRLLGEDSEIQRRLTGLGYLDRSTALVETP